MNRIKVTRRKFAGKGALGLLGAAALAQSGKLFRDKIAAWSRISIGADLAARDG
jgi:hypothetical protein